MAIDTNVLLRAIVPDTTSAIKQGIDIGQTIRNAPLLREQRQNAIQQQEQQLATGDVEMGDKLSSAVYSLVGDVENLAPEQVRPLMNQLQASGFAVEEDDFSEDPENISNIMGLAKRGKSLLQSKQGGLSSDYRSFQKLTENLTEEEKEEATRVKVGLAPRAGTITGTERIVEDEDLAGKVVDFEADKAGSKEKSKLESQLEIAPMIADAKAEAAVVGKDRGDDRVKLAFLDANMPNIETTVNKLNELNKIATYTQGGLIVDAGFRQLGWEVPEGATARAQAKSLIDTTILPLLKPTFGAAFTEQEGKKLLDTWGDVNASPAEKEMALQGMMMAVRLQGETIRRKLGKDAPAAPVTNNESAQVDKGQGVLKVDAQGNRAMVFEDGTFEELP